MLINRLKSRARSFWADTSGTVTLEFVLAMPILFWTFMASYVFFDGYRQSAVNLKAAYSNWGKEVNFCAPSNNFHPLNPQVLLAGRGIWTADNEESGLGFTIDSRYTGRFGGTSSATPLAAGVAALVKSANPELTAIEIQDILEKTTDKIEDPNPDPVPPLNPCTMCIAMVVSRRSSSLRTASKVFSDSSREALYPNAQLLPRPSCSKIILSLRSGGHRKCCTTFGSLSTKIAAGRCLVGSDKPDPVALRTAKEEDADEEGADLPVVFVVVSNAEVVAKGNSRVWWKPCRICIQNSSPI